ncbi:hypothetical protein NG791_17110 [Laspinema sp. D1]|uniref:hypothetical protein n=1 Tax=Laspinema palackyanum TaxID=3231601 RepID=UPI00348588F7|nr:hypothetical protein [Laspinema sp. D2b]
MGPVETEDWQLQSSLVRATPREHNRLDPEAIALIFLLGVVPSNRITPEMIA